jgi:hypothetical protein
MNTFPLTDSADQKMCNNSQKTDDNTHVKNMLNCSRFV